MLGKVPYSSRARNSNSVVPSEPAAMITRMAVSEPSNKSPCSMRLKCTV